MWSHHVYYLQSIIILVDMTALLIWYLSLVLALFEQSHPFLHNICENTILSYIWSYICHIWTCGVKHSGVHMKVIWPISTSNISNGSNKSNSVSYGRVFAWQNLKAFGLCNYKPISRWTYFKLCPLDYSLYVCKVSWVTHLLEHYELHISTLFMDVKNGDITITIA